ncbi:MAG: hypothetical protein SVU88_02785 [Candidatus Nanohaloarchaea archaeon]|nr:hypothetical protein [Candidatus Nanohaloarchaea archaeon]
MWMDVEDSPVYRRDDIDGYLDVRLTGLRFRENGAGDRTAVYRVDVVDSAG